MESKHFLLEKSQPETNPHVIKTWWEELNEIDTLFNRLYPPGYADWDLEAVDVAATAVIDESLGPVIIGRDTKVCHNAVIIGPVVIGVACMIGNNVLIRGTTIIGDNVKIGFAAEIKAAIIEDDVTIGPQCFIADSKLEKNVYLGAQTRTSNHRLDKQTVKILVDERLHDTGRKKLGCLIGENSSLGVQVVTLPGRIITKNTTIGPKIIVEKNLAPGKYILKQQTLLVNQEN